MYESWQEVVTETKLFNAHLKIFSFYTKSQLESPVFEVVIYRRSVCTRLLETWDHMKRPDHNWTWSPRLILPALERLRKEDHEVKSIRPQTNQPNKHTKTQSVILTFHSRVLVSPGLGLWVTKLQSPHRSTALVSSPVHSLLGPDNFAHRGSCPCPEL